MANPVSLQRGKTPFAFGMRKPARKSKELNVAKPPPILLRDIPRARHSSGQVRTGTARKLFTSVIWQPAKNYGNGRVIKVGQELQPFLRTPDGLLPEVKPWRSGT